MNLNFIFSEINNYFLDDNINISILHGNFIIANNKITYSDGTELPLKPNQYFRITKSISNEGVFQNSEECEFGECLADLVDEEFSGNIWLMRVPRDFVSLCKSIYDWIIANGDTLHGPYKSESFGGYSYTKGTTSSGGSVDWDDEFKSSLSRYKKLRKLL